MRIGFYVESIFAVSTVVLSVFTALRFIEGSFPWLTLLLVLGVCLLMISDSWARRRAEREASGLVLLTRRRKSFSYAITVTVVLYCLVRSIVTITLETMQVGVAVVPNYAYALLAIYWVISFWIVYAILPPVYLRSSSLRS